MAIDDDETSITGPILTEDPNTTGRRQAVRDAIVVVLHPSGANPGLRHTLIKSEHVVGRRSDLDLSLDVDSVSRKHARLVKIEEEWWVEDLDSTNGTFVNDDPVTGRRKLADGDIVRFGEAVVKFLAGSNIERAYHEEIYRLSILDGLTGVHNKRFFEEVLEREVARVSRHGGSVSLVIFDIDHFKKINDTFGHLAGDIVLQTMCRRLRPRIRREDLLARIGGEEFACVLPDTPGAGATQFAEDLRRLVESDPFTADGVNIPTTISLGVAALEVVSPVVQAGPPREDTRTSGTSRQLAQELLRRSDERLYAAKRGGRNRVET